MIVIGYTGVKWGVDPVPSGARINLLDEESGITSQIPFQGRALAELIARLYKETDAEQRQIVHDLLKEQGIMISSNGLVLPGKDFNPGQLPPQG